MDSGVFKTQYINEETLMDCAKFAGLSNNNYDKRGQRDEIRKKEQCFFGKVGEWVAHAALSNYFIELTYPNMEIYSSRSKTWSNDLVAGVVPFACKTCEYNGDSWVFQLSDEDGKGRDSEIFDPKAKNKLIVCVQLDFEKKSGRIKAIIPLYQVRSLDLFDEPRKADLKGKKLVIYRFKLKYHGFVDYLHPSVEEFLHKVQV